MFMAMPSSTSPSLGPAGAACDTNGAAGSAAIRRKVVDPELKDVVVREIVLKGRTTSEVCREHSLAQSTVFYWVKNYLKENGITPANAKQTLSEQEGRERETPPRNSVPSSAPIADEAPPAANPPETTKPPRPAARSFFSAKDVKKRPRVGGFPVMERELFEWISLNLNENGVPMVTGPEIRARALEISTRMGVTDFKCSVGWLTRFKRRFNISYGGKKCNNPNNNGAFNGWITTDLPTMVPTSQTRLDDQLTGGSDDVEDDWEEGSGGDDKSDGDDDHAASSTSFLDDSGVASLDDGALNLTLSKSDLLKVESLHALKDSCGLPMNLSASSDSLSPSLPQSQSSPNSGATHHLQGGASRKRKMQSPTKNPFLDATTDPPSRSDSHPASSAGSFTPAAKTNGSLSYPSDFSHPDGAASRVKAPKTNNGFQPPPPSQKQQFSSKCVSHTHKTVESEFSNERETAQRAFECLSSFLFKNSRNAVLPSLLSGLQALLSEMKDH